MSDPTNNRKLEHIRVIEHDAQVDRQKRYFDSMLLKHRALPELDIKSVDPSTTFMGKNLSFPLLISSMTGGEDKTVQLINKNLALAAEETKVAMGVGSQRVMFTHPDAHTSFALREHAPNTLLFGNIGGVQLNEGFAIDECKRAVEVLGADALYFHLNPLQEAVQPEGDTNFSSLITKIGTVAEALNVPVILKEVGSGFSDTDAQLAIEAGIKIIDVAGSGGTSWSRIEHHRQKDDHDLGVVFQDWGIPTPVSLKLLSPYKDELTLIASGGIRSGIDMVKSIVLGASLAGMASPFLKPAMESPEKVIEVIEAIKRECITAMFLMGISKIDELFLNDKLILDF